MRILRGSYWVSDKIDCIVDGEEIKDGLFGHVRRLRGINLNDEEIEGAKFFSVPEAILPPTGL